MRDPTVRILILAILCLGLFSAAASAATESQKLAAIDAGLAYLATQQQGDGRWIYGGVPEDTALTAAAVLAFAEDQKKREAQGLTPGVDFVDYTPRINAGMAYLLNQAQLYPIAGEPAGNPDSDGDGWGVKFVLGGNNNRDTYVTGLVVPALVAGARKTPNALIPNGPLAGVATYKQAIADTVDYFAYGQADPGNNARGGWRYYADYGDADNSTSQWPLVAILYASEMGISPPPFVATELKNWINHIQNADGGSDYPKEKNWGSNESRTGALLLEMAYAGYDTGTVAEQAAMAAALGYIDTHWQTTANSTWNGNFNHPYAMWAIYKGLQTTIGLDDTTAITNLHAAGTIDPGDTWNWWEDYCEWLVNTQAGSGAWGGYSNWPTNMATAWYINILNATEIPEEPVIPEPSTFLIWALLGSLGITVGWWRRRR